jgi:hypothetical protein
MITAIKFFFGSLNLANIKKYAVIALIISLASITLLWQLEKMRHRLTVREFEAFKAELSKQAEINRIKNENLTNIHKSQMARLAKDYQANIEVLKIDRDKIKKGLQHEINRTGSLLNDVRLLKNRASGAGLPKDESAPSVFTQERSDCNATINRLIAAGKSCAVDYNTLYDAWMIQCDVYGCD